MTKKAEYILEKIAFSPLTKVLAPIVGAAVGGYVSQNPEFKSGLRYGKYLVKHKLNIISPMHQMGLGTGQALKHDLSKITPNEFRTYRDWFEGPKGITGERDPETYKTWRNAVNTHYHRPANLHHYRVLGIDKTTVPLKYKMEAVADWYSVGKTKGRINETFPEWYSRLKDKLPIEPEVKNVIDERLGMKKEAMSNNTELRDKAQRVLNKIKDTAEIPERIIKQNADNPARLLKNRTGIADLDLSMSYAEKVTVPWIKSTKTYQTVATKLRPTKEYIKKVETFGETNRVLRPINKSKYLAAGIVGGMNPYPGATEIAAGAVTPINAAVYEASKRRLIQRAAGRVVSALSSPTAQALKKALI